MTSIGPQTKIGFIGLGLMGRPMALNIRKAGFRSLFGIARLSARTKSSLLAPNSLLHSAEVAANS